MRGPRNRLASLGLRWRLAGWVALVTLACTGIAFVAVYRGTGADLRHQMDHEIASDSGGLAHSLAQLPSRSSAQLAIAARHYVADQPFAASSTLLFAIVPGAGPISNRPELFDHGPPDDGETVAVQAQENRLSEQLLAVRDGYSTLELPDVGNLRLLKRVTRPAGRSGPQVTVGVGEPLAPVARAQRGVARAFILAGILALAGALIASYLIGTRVSRPLRRMAAVAAKVAAGDLHPRIQNPGGQGDEVRVLAESFNHMLDRLTAAFAGQRAFIADASHELRTPLTVVRGQLEMLASQERPSASEVRRVEHLLQAEVGRITRLVDDLLLLAKTEQTEFLRIQATDLPAYVDELWDGVTLLAPRRFELGPVPEGTLSADPDRVAQALRNLASNAIEHTGADTGLVSMRLDTPGGDRIRFVIEDNGPGIPADQLERVFDRFHRTDVARDRASGGTGLGLSIVRAIAEAHGGRVAARRADAGGACIEFELPGFSSGGTVMAASSTRPAGVAQPKNSAAVS